LDKEVLANPLYLGTKKAANPGKKVRVPRRNLFTDIAARTGKNKERAAKRKEKSDAKASFAKTFAEDVNKAFDGKNAKVQALSLLLKSDPNLREKVKT
jgi:hypothetical protein